jgi:ABC-type transport system involved in multi-copper enzyme maturation permease subunit
MYCSKCGTITNNKLNYCNICGGKLADNPDDLHKPILISLIISLSVVSIIGLGSVIGLIAMLLSRGVRDEMIVMLVGGYLFILFSIIFTIGRQLSKLIDSKFVKNNPAADIVFPPQLSAPNTAQLEEPKQPPFSVVDKTTRTFDEVFIKRN